VYGCVCMYVYYVCVWVCVYVCIYVFFLNLFTACSITDSDTTCVRSSSYTFYIIYVSTLL